MAASAQGIGFAIPSDALKAVLPQLIETGHVTRGRLGVVIQALDEPTAKALGMNEPRGALVRDVERGGAADKAGLRQGDVIVKVDGKDVANAHELPRLVARHAPGTHVRVDVLRDGAARSFDVVLDELKDSAPRRRPSSR
jgi:serine protease Do